VLETRRLRLREITPADAAAVFEIFCDPRVMQHTDDAPYPIVDRALLRIEDWARRLDRGVGLKWGVTLRESDRLIGAWACMLSITSITEPRWASSWPVPIGDKGS